MSILLVWEDNSVITIYKYSRRTTRRRYRGPLVYTGRTRRSPGADGPGEHRHSAMPDGLSQAGHRRVLRAAAACADGRSAAPPPSSAGATCRVAAAPRVTTPAPCTGGLRTGRGCAGLPRGAAARVLPRVARSGPSVASVSMACLESARGDGVVDRRRGAADIARWACWSLPRAPCKCVGTF